MAYKNKKKKMNGKKMWGGMPMNDKMWSCDTPMPKDSGSLDSGPSVILGQMKKDMSVKTRRGQGNPDRY